MNKIKVVHYINQFFAGLGGEEKADTKPFKADQLPPISKQLQKVLGEEFEVVGTVVCGDSYFGENVDEATEELIKLIDSLNPKLFISGPAFNAGRYGLASATIAATVKEKLNIPVLTGMYPENPGADMYKKDIYIIETKNSAAGMRDAMKKMGKLAVKIAKGEEIGSPEEEHYIKRGVRVNYFTEKDGARRAVDMLIKKINGEEFETEYPMPVFDRVEVAKAIEDLSKAKIALVTSGGIVPKGNPDRIESSSATKYGAYDFKEIDDLTKENSETAHGGYDPVYANEDSDRVLPIDVLRDMEKEGKIGALYETWFSTVGNGTAVANAESFAKEIADKLHEEKVDAVILTST